MTSISPIFIFYSQLLLRLGVWLSGVVAKKVVKEGASAIVSEPYIVAGILGVGLFTWGAVKLCKEAEDKEIEIRVKVQVHSEEE